MGQRAEWIDIDGKCGHPRATSDVKPWGPLNTQREKGDRCQRQAGWGTNHVGVGWCKQHQGNNPSHVRLVARQMADMDAKRALARFGVPVDISPAQALLAMVHEAAGNVAYLSARIDEMIEQGQAAEHEYKADILAQVAAVADGEDSSDQGIKIKRGAEALFGPIVSATSKGDLYATQETQRAIVSMYGEWTDRLVKYSKAAIDAGVAKAQVELARQQGQMLIQIIKTVMTKLGFDVAQTREAQLLLAVEMRRLAAKDVTPTLRELADAEKPEKKSRTMDTGRGF